MAEEQLEEDSEDEDTNLAAIDNPKNSTLTHGQHERYLTLKNDPHWARWPGSQKREYRKLQGIVGLERKLYRQARNDFLVLNAKRFLAGFHPPSTEYATWHSKFTQAYINKWKASDFPLSFGKVRQVISLSRYDDDTTTWMPSEVFESKVLEQGEASSIAADIPTILPPMKPPVVPSFLRDDKHALALAKKHNASVIVSVEALECILTQESWKIPLWNCEDSSIRILDEPLPQPTLPRTCLTKGIEISLRGEGAFDAYTLLNVNVRGREQHIIIRGASSSRRRVRVHIEYFTERATEQLSAEDLSIWILDSLMEPLGSMQMVRVDVKDWSMQQPETVSVAHALASGRDVMEPWKRLLLLFNAMDSMPKDGGYLLSCKDHSVSLHRANDRDTEIDLKESFQSADAVKTSSASLIACARQWKWKSGTRTEETFPIKSLKNVI